MNTRGWFFTGTDTGVGKTHVAAGVARALRSLGVDLAVMKPAETGCSRKRGRLVPQDALVLMAAAGSRDPLDLVNPYRFRDPLAPAVAAEREGRRIDLKLIVQACRTLARTHDLVIVEGAGGIMVPLTTRLTFLDLAERLGLPVVIVARPGLGTINHTMLTLQAVRSRGLTVAAIILNDSQGVPSDLARRTNAAVLRRMTGVTVEEVRFGQEDLARIARKFIGPVIASRV